MFPFRPEWYTILHKWIYSFHMGNFFFISGFLFAYTYVPIHDLKKYWFYEKKKLLKFGLPFLFLGIAFTLFSVLRQHLGIKGFIKGIIALFLDPTSSYVIYLWFIYVLFSLYLLAPLFVIDKRIKYLFLIISIILIFFPLPRLFSGHLFSRFLFFYLLGIICHEKSGLLKRVPVAICWIAIFIFAYISIFKSDKFPYAVTCLLSIPSLFWFSWMLNRFLCNKKWIIYIQEVSRHCYAIYLYQMLFLNLLAILFKNIPHNSTSFFFFLFLGEILSISGSILVHRALNFALSNSHKIV